MADRLTTILTLAQSGLQTAVTMLNLKAARLEKQTGADAAKAKKDAAKAKKLAAVLSAANTGITTYIAESEE